MKKKYYLCFIWLSALVLLLFQGSGSLSQGNELAVDDILRNLQSTFSEIDNYSVMLNVKADIKNVRVPQMEVTAFFKQPDKLHLESTGFAMLPREGMFINPNRFSRKDFYMSILGKETLNDIETVKLELVPRNERIKVRKLIIWVDPVRWISLKIDTITWQGQSASVDFEYGKFQDRYWMPVKARAMMGLTGFKGFSRFHGRPDWENEDESSSSDRKGEIVIRFYDYRINEGIPDFIFK